MAKQPKRKTNSGDRNRERQNGKAFSKDAKLHGTMGHRPTGRTKPSGNTVGGHSVKKLMARAADMNVLGALGEIVEKVKDSRRHTHRAQIRAERRATTRASLVSSK